MIRQVRERCFGQVKHLDQVFLIFIDINQACDEFLFFTGGFEQVFGGALVGRIMVLTDLLEHNVAGGTKSTMLRTRSCSLPQA